MTRKMHTGRAGCIDFCRLAEQGNSPSVLCDKTVLILKKPDETMSLIFGSHWMTPCMQSSGHTPTAQTRSKRSKGYWTVILKSFNVLTWILSLLIQSHNSGSTGKVIGPESEKKFWNCRVRKNFENKSVFAYKYFINLFLTTWCSLQ